MRSLLYDHLVFQPTLSPRGERPFSINTANASFAFQPTLPARGATAHRAGDALPKDISTHAPREGSDTIVALGNNFATTISTHAPREGSDRGCGGFGAPQR